MTSESIKGFFEKYELLSNRLHEEKYRVGSALTRTKYRYPSSSNRSVTSIGEHSSGEYFETIRIRKKRTKILSPQSTKLFRPTKPDDLSISGETKFE